MASPFTGFLSQLFAETPQAKAERRERLDADRRNNPRTGKFDRRRNRCDSCRFFKTGQTPEEGFCKQHQQPVSEDTYACLLFEPQP